MKFCFTFFLSVVHCTFYKINIKSNSILLQVNNGNTKYHPFQVKINHSNFIIDRLQKRFHVTFLIYLFVTSRNLFFGVFLLLSVSVLECFGEKVGPLKILYCTWTSSQVIFKVSSMISFSSVYFSTYLQEPIGVLYSTHIVYWYPYI